jgi:hypothetical protein
MLTTSVTVGINRPSETRASRKLATLSAVPPRVEATAKNTLIHSFIALPSIAATTRYGPETRPPTATSRRSPFVDEAKNTQNINDESERKPAHHRNYEPVAHPRGAYPPDNRGRGGEGLLLFRLFLGELDGHGVPSETYAELELGVLGRFSDIVLPFGASLPQNRAYRDFSFLQSLRISSGVALRFSSTIQIHSMS